MDTDRSNTELLYVVMDTVAQSFSPVFQSKNDQIAIRQYNSLVQTTVNPEEYLLYCIGSIDNTMTVTSNVRLVNVVIPKLMEVAK